MNVNHSRSAWASGASYEKSPFSITQDTAMAVYSATVQ